MANINKIKLTDTRVLKSLQIVSQQHCHFNLLQQDRVYFAASLDDAITSLVSVSTLKNSMMI